MNTKHHKKIKNHMEKIGLKLVRSKNHMIYSGEVNEQKITVVVSSSSKNHRNEIHLVNKDVRKEFLKVGAEVPTRLEK